MTVFGIVLGKKKEECRRAEEKKQVQRREKRAQRREKRVQRKRPTTSKSLFSASFFL
jgi:hypothetical protein